MVKVLISVRQARPADALAIAEVHDASWRQAYSGIIPGKDLERMIARRGPNWWLSAIKRGSRLLVLEFGGKIAGYASYGRNRMNAIPYAGEIFELYLRPEFQGLGFGKRLFAAAREDLAEYGYLSIVVWALAENEGGMAFYRAMGGVEVWRARERFDTVSRSRIAFGFALK